MAVTEDELAARRQAAVGEGAGDEVEEVEEPVAAEGGDAETMPTPPMQIPLPGDWNTLDDIAGGTKPTSSEARLLGGSLPIDGQFRGEERVTLVVEAIVSEVHVVYATDDWGETKAVKRRHRMRMLSVRKV